MLLAKSRDYKEGLLHSKKRKVLSSWHVMGAMFLASALNRSISPGISSHFLYLGGNEHAIFVMGAMFLASALSRGRHSPELLKMATNTGGKCFCLWHWLGTWRPWRIMTTAPYTFLNEVDPLCSLYSLLLVSGEGLLHVCISSKIINYSNQLTFWTNYKSHKSA